MPDAEVDRERLVAQLRAGLAGPSLGVLAVLLGVGLLAGLIVAIDLASGADRRGEDGALLILGAALGGPGLLVGALSTIWLGLHAIGPRRGSIAIVGDDLVIRDRWLLRAPLVLTRAEVASVRVVERLPWIALTPLTDTAALVDWSWAVNLRIELARTHHGFAAARRTPPPKNGPAQISRGRSADALLLRVREPGRSAKELAAWLAAGSARSRVAPRSRPDDPGGCAVGVTWASFTLVTALGWLLFVVGASGS